MNSTSHAKEGAAQWPSTMRSPSSMSSMRPSDDIISYLREYAREKPDVAALWCFGIGFILGWKLKPW